MKDNIINDIKLIKYELESLNIKIDTVLDILNNFTIILSEEDESEDIYDSDNWVPEQNENWNSYDEEEDI